MYMYMGSSICVYLYAFIYICVYIYIIYIYIYVKSFNIAEIIFSLVVANHEIPICPVPVAGAP